MLDLLRQELRVSQGPDRVLVVEDVALGGSEDLLKDSLLDLPLGPLIFIGGQDEALALLVESGVLSLHN